MDEKRQPQTPTVRENHLQSLPLRNRYSLEFFCLVWEHLATLTDEVEGMWPYEALGRVAHNDARSMMYEVLPRCTVDAPTACHTNSGVGRERASAEDNAAIP